MLKLQNLTKAETVDLFFYKVPSSTEIYKIFKWDKILELDEYTKEIKADFISHLCEKEHDHSMDCTKAYLAEHPLFDILKGMPLATSVVASQAMSYSLKEIYQQNVELTNSISDNPMIENGSLVTSIEFLLKVLGQQSSTSVDCFYMIGLMPMGLNVEDLSIMFETNVRSHVDILINSSLVEKDKTGESVKVSPFVD